ncbi:hypothetical protein PN497_01865 [Sphaerospermopsis kisseleviana CS-549]|uniref:Uncharacterized protein n=1 Tax=Sphaerospermopsis kisseleviana CS-549 TaxID=3021783 RepID=A0ABT4ZL57_9CYAN|nr:hypothetical protein [Sphaerospermopsis kisseleviana]MDB9440128.1 hypothetical protein [Sphaerospermopsis kisseleviana CS-549]
MANATLRYQQTLNISCFPSHQSPVTSHQSPFPCYNCRIFHR